MTYLPGGSGSERGVLDWISCFKGGDESAIAPLYRLTHSKILRFCSHLTKDYSSTEDLVQEVYITIFTKISRCRGFENDASFYAWVYTVARTTFLMFIRSSLGKIDSHKLNTTQEGETVMIERIPEAAPHDLDGLMSIKENLAHLPERDRLIILLVDHEGYSYLEASKILGIPDSTIRKRLHFARQKFYDFHVRKQVVQKNSEIKT